MIDDNNTIQMPYGEINPDDLTTGGQGAGSSRTDPGGLDAKGNELGATSPGSHHGRSEAKRMDDAEAGAREGRQKHASGNEHDSRN